MPRALEHADWTLDVVHDSARFSETPWTQDTPPGWTAHYTIANAIRVTDSQGRDPLVGDFVEGIVRLELDVHGFNDVRHLMHPTPTPGSCFVPVFFRPSYGMPTVTEADAVPSLDIPFGFAKDGRGRILVDDSGENLAPSGTTKRTNGGLIDVGRPYEKATRTLMFEVFKAGVSVGQPVELWLLCAVAPRAAGGDKTQQILIPKTSNYNYIGYKLYRQLEKV